MLKCWSRRVASQAIRLWQVDNAARDHRPHRASREVNGPAVAKDRERLLSARRGRSARLDDRRREESSADFAHGEAVKRSLGRGDLLFGGGYRKGRARSVRSSVRRNSTESSIIRRFRQALWCFRPTARTLFTVAATGRCAVWNLATKRANAWLTYRGQKPRDISGFFARRPARMPSRGRETASSANGQPNTRLRIARRRLDSDPGISPGGRLTPRPQPRRHGATLGFVETTASATQLSIDD